MKFLKNLDEASLHMTGKMNHKKVNIRVAEKLDEDKHPGKQPRVFVFFKM